MDNFCNNKKNCCVSVGGTITGNVGTPAKVYETRCNGQIVLNFVIPKGANGTDGINGKDGKTALIKIGTVTTGEPNTDAVVSLRKVEDTDFLDFVIPKGANGTDGKNGEKGVDGKSYLFEIGSIRSSEPNTDAKVMMRHVGDRKILDFIIPRGADGIKGINGKNGTDGIDGKDALVDVGTTTTGEPNTDASVTLRKVGNTSFLDFVIPKGANGTDGIDGTNGINGTDGIDGKDGTNGKDALIDVGTTVTGKANTDASVTMRKVGDTSFLDFVIPKGAAAKPLAMSIAELFNTTYRTFSTANKKIFFDINLDFDNVVTTQEDIIVKKAGTYKIDYGVCINASNNAILAIYFDEDVYQPSKINLETGLNNKSCSFLMKVKLDSKISLRIVSLTGTLTTQENFRNAYIVLTPVAL